MALSRIGGFVFGSGVVLLGVALLFLAAGSLAGLPGPVPARAVASVPVGATRHDGRVAFARSTALPSAREHPVSQTATAHASSTGTRAQSHTRISARPPRVVHAQPKLAVARNVARHAPARPEVTGARHTSAPVIAIRPPAASGSLRHPATASLRRNAPRPQSSIGATAKTSAQRTVVSFVPHRSDKRHPHKRTGNGVAPKAEATPEPPIGYDANPALLHADVPDGPAAQTPAPGGSGT